MPPDYARQTARRKAGYERKQARASREMGLLMVFTGPGKGKTTAAFGMGLYVSCPFSLPQADARVGLI